MIRNDSTAGHLFDVVGIGNAIVDVLVKSDDSFLANYSLVKGSMSLIDQEKAEELYNASGPGMETSGGSAANTLSGISQLGGRAGFIGRVKKDQLGDILLTTSRLWELTLRLLQQSVVLPPQDA